MFFCQISEAQHPQVGGVLSCFEATTALCARCAIAPHGRACWIAAIRPHILEAYWEEDKGDSIKHSAKAKTVETLELKDCRWPFGDPRQARFYFCGAQQAAGRPYCQHHWDMSLAPSRPRDQRSLPALPIKHAA